MLYNSSSLLIFSSTHFWGEEKLLELQFVKEPVSPGPRGQVSVCQTLEQSGLFVCSRKVKRRSHSDGEFGPCVCLSAAVRWSFSKGRSKLGRVEDRQGGREAG